MTDIALLNSLVLTSLLSDSLPFPLFWWVGGIFLIRRKNKEGKEYIRRALVRG